MTEGVFPKSNGESLYASEINSFQGIPLTINDYTGVFDGGPSGKVHPYFGGMYFDGTAAIVCSGNIPTVNFENSYNIQFDMNITRIVDTGSLYFFIGSGGFVPPTAPAVGLIWTSGANIELNGLTYSGGENTVSLGTVTPDTYNKYRISYDAGDDIKFYVNGVIAGSLSELPTGSYIGTIAAKGIIMHGMPGPSGVGNIGWKGPFVVDFDKYELY